MNLANVTVLLLTHNEEANLARTLRALSWAERIVVVDSGSVDATREIAMSNESVRFHERPFDSHRDQWNYGLSLVPTEWTLALDADYVCPLGLAHELAELSPDRTAYCADFVYRLAGRALRGSLYPPRVVLFRTEQFRYVQDGHTQLLDLRGVECGKLRSKIFHDDRKPLARWLAAQAKYAKLEAEKLVAMPRAALGWKDRLRRGIVWAPPLTLMYCLFWKRLALDGWRGVYYALQRTFAELLLSLELLDRRIRGERGTIHDAAPPALPCRTPQPAEEIAS